MAKTQEPGVQGEGDYESARLYNKHTAEHVKKMRPEELEADAHEQPPQEAADARAVGESKARAAGQDLRDAEVFRALEQKNKT